MTPRLVDIISTLRRRTRISLTDAERQQWLGEDVRRAAAGRCRSRSRDLPR